MQPDYYENSPRYRREAELASRIARGDSKAFASKVAAQVLRHHGKARTLAAGLQDSASGHAPRGVHHVQHLVRYCVAGAAPREQ